MLHIAQTTDYHTLLTTKKGVHVATKWFLKLGLLGQFSMAKEMDRENQEDQENPVDQGDQDGTRELGINT